MNEKQAMPAMSFFSSVFLKRLIFTRQQIAKAFVTGSLISHPCVEDHVPKFGIAQCLICRIVGVGSND